MKNGINKSILIIDDEPDIIDILSFYLEGLGYTVKSALSPLEALQIIENETFFLIITDIAMPQMDGYELILEIKKRQCCSEIALMTGFGYNPRHTLVKINRKYKYPLFFKPFELKKSTIKDTVEELCRKYNAL